MKVLVTGGAGFIGSHLVDRLLALKYEVVCIDNFLLGKKEFLVEANKNKNFSFYEMDLLDIDLLKDVFAKYPFDIVFTYISVFAHDGKSTSSSQPNSSP